MIPLTRFWRILKIAPKLRHFREFFYRRVRNMLILLDDAWKLHWNWSTFGHFSCETGDARWKSGHRPGRLCWSNWGIDPLCTRERNNLQKAAISFQLGCGGVEGRGGFPGLIRRGGRDLGHPCFVVVWAFSRPGPAPVCQPPATQVDARSRARHLGIPGPQKRGTGGALNWVRSHLRSGPPATKGTQGQWVSLLITAPGPAAYVVEYHRSGFESLAFLVVGQFEFL